MSFGLVAFWQSFHPQKTNIFLSKFFEHIQRSSILIIFHSLCKRTRQIGEVEGGGRRGEEEKAFLFALKAASSIHSFVLFSFFIFEPFEVKWSEWCRWWWRRRRQQSNLAPPFDRFLRAPLKDFFALKEIEIWLNWRAIHPMFFFKNGPIPASFLFIFVLFSLQFQ